MSRSTDPTEPLRKRASAYPGVDEGTACTQSSFKAGGKAFLFVGAQGGRFKAMFRLCDSLPEARRLAASAPDDFQVGSWVTARFSAEQPLPAKLWKRWLDESYALSAPAATPKPKARGGGKAQASTPKKAARTKQAPARPRKPS